MDTGRVVLLHAEYLEDSRAIPCCTTRYCPAYAVLVQRGMYECRHQGWKAPAGICSGSWSESRVPKPALGADWRVLDDRDGCCLNSCTMVVSAACTVTIGNGSASESKGPLRPHTDFSPPAPEKEGRAAC